MAKTSLAAINAFLDPGKFAFVGLSRDPKKFSRAAFRDLYAKGYEIFPVNPNVDEIEGIKCYHDISELPAEVKHALFMTPKKSTAMAVEQAIQNGFTHLWIQQGSETGEAIDKAKREGVNLVSKTCVLMHAKPKGVHKFHGSIMKLFGAFSKN